MNTKNQTPKSIGDVLKDYRNKKHIPVSDVSAYLSDYNITAAPKTIYGWENGHAEPNAKTLMLLCYLYGIDDILKTFGYEIPQNNKLTLTRKEEQMIRKYRNTPSIQHAVDKLLDL